MFSHRPKQKLPINAVKEGLDVEIYDPVVAPTARPSRSNRVDCGSSGPVPIGIPVEQGFQYRFQSAADYFLRNPVSHRGNPQRSRSAIGFRYIHPSHWRRHVTTGRQPIPEFVEVTDKLGLKILDRLSIYSAAPG